MPANVAGPAQRSSLGQLVDSLTRWQVVLFQASLECLSQLQTPGLPGVVTLVGGLRDGLSWPVTSR